MLAGIEELHLKWCARAGSNRRHSVRLRYLFAAYIVYSSTRTLLAASDIATLHGSTHAFVTQLHVTLLAGSEIAAVIATLIKPIAKVATYLLLAIFTIAATIDTLLGEIPAQLALYASIALFFLSDRTKRAVQKE
jgi:hypothetical protein